MPGVVGLTLPALAALLLVCWPAAAAPPSAKEAGQPSVAIRDSRDTSIAPRRRAPPVQARTADFRDAAQSADARRIGDWVAASADNQDLPFVIIDKVAARVFLFDRNARLIDSAPALLGLGRGDGTAAGIGTRRLSTMNAAERTTPAGRFVASLGHDYEQDILWVDYDSALSLHRVITANPKDRRHQRLASTTPLDNRISYGCINVPVEFYNKLIIPAFANTTGIVYILPETKTLDEVFGLGRAAAR